LADRLFRTGIFKFGSNETLGSQMTPPKKDLFLLFQFVAKTLNLLIGS